MTEWIHVDDFRTYNVPAVGSGLTVAGLIDCRPCDDLKERINVLRLEGIVSCPTLYLKLSSTDFCDGYRTRLYSLPVRFFPTTIVWRDGEVVGYIEGSVSKSGFWFGDNLKKKIQRIISKT